MPVILQTVWLNLVSDPSDFMAFSLMSELKVSTVVSGESRQMANGRLRVIRRAGLARSVGVSLPYCDRGQIDWLETHVGELVCVRDDRGRKLFGTFFEVPVDEWSIDVDRGDVSLSLSEITHSEAV